MTKQEFYFKLVVAAVDGTFPSKFAGICLYRANHQADCPHRCAAGLLIPDEKYSKKLERRSVDFPDVQSAIDLPAGLSWADLRRIQKAHDDRYRPWNPRRFVADLNYLPCFDEVMKVDPATVPEKRRETAAEYYERLVVAAVDGTFPSVNRWDDCQYRKDGTAGCKQRCAAGLCIPDEKYTDDLEGKVSKQPEVACVLEMPLGMTAEDMTEVQTAHDTIAYAGDWSAHAFVSRINTLACFKHANLRNPADVLRI